jgi:O-antigen/teichoic acid export membrane protein
MSSAGVSRTHRFLGGISLGYVYLGLVTLVGLWLTPFLLRRIGQHDLGLWLVATQILGYLMLLDFGVVALLPRETAYATGRTLQGGGGQDLAHTIGRFRRVVRWQVPLVLLAAIGAWVALPSEWAELKWPFVAILVTFVVTFPLRIYHAALQGLQDLAYLGRVQLAAWAVGTLLTVLLVFADVGLSALIVGWIATQVVTASACGWRLRRHFAHGWMTSVPDVPWPEARTLLGRSGWVSLAQVAQVFLNGTDVLIIGKVLGPAAVVPYACTGKLVNVLSNHPYLLMQAASPALSEMRTAERRERLAEVTTALTRAMLILSGAVTCLIVALNEGFVSWWVGQGQFGGWWLTLALVVAMLLRHVNTTAVYTLFAFGHERRLSLTSLGDGAVTLATSAVLVWRYGLIGAPIGSILGVAAVSLPANFIALSRETGATPVHIVWELRGWMARFALASITCVVAGRVIQPLSFWPLAATGMIAAIVYAGLMLPLALEPPLGSYVRRALASLASWLPGRHVGVPGTPQ